MSSAKTSISIVSYKSGEDIIRNLRSLFHHAPTKTIQVIISNNYPGDEQLSRIQKEFPEVTIIENARNDGYGAGHNAVLPHLHSMYHLILNPDIEFESDAISPLVDYLDHHPETAIVTPEIRNMDGTMQFVPRKYPKLKYVLSSTIPFLKKYRREYTLEDEVMTQPTKIEVCTGAFMLIRTDVLKKIHGFDERFFMYFEDFDLSLRARQYGDIIYYPGVAVKHLWHRDSKRSFKMFSIQVISMLKFYVKWMGRRIYG